MATKTKSDTPFFGRKQVQENFLQAAIFVGLGLLSVLFLLPFLWMVSTSLKPIEETMKMPPTFIPRPAHWRNYLDAVKAIPFFLYASNTVIVCVLGAAGTMVSSAMVAYGFAFLRWPGRNIFFWLTVSTMMVPFPVIMVPLYSVFRSLGMIGTLMPLWLPAWFGSAWNIFLMRQFFLGIPKDLLDAARIDGCTEWQIFWRVVLPLAKPVLIVVGLFHVIWAWNDFLGPLLYLTRQETYTLSLGLQFFQSQQGGTEWHLLMAASSLIILPVLILFLFGQRALIRGITMTGFKM
jgi:multiple sugar transport system permease protein